MAGITDPGCLYVSVAAGAKTESASAFSWRFSLPTIPISPPFYCPRPTGQGEKRYHGTEGCGRHRVSNPTLDADGGSISGALPLQPRHPALYASSMNKRDNPGAPGAIILRPSGGTPPRWIGVFLERSLVERMHRGCHASGSMRKMPGGWGLAPREPACHHIPAAPPAKDGKGGRLGSGCRRRGATCL